MSARGWKQATAPAVGVADAVRVAARRRDRSDGLGRLSLQAIGAVRAGLGGGMLLLPELSAQLLGADVDTARSANWLTRMVGARELALGVVALAGAYGGGGGGARGAFLAQVAADSGDAATLAHAAVTGRLPARPATLIAAFAAASVAAELYLAARHA
jgi:hypothetical protein